jgi:hypothetical protein
MGYLMSNKKSFLLGLALLALALGIYFSVSTQSELIEADIKELSNPNLKERTVEQTQEESADSFDIPPEEPKRTADEIQNILAPCLAQLSNEQKAIFTEYPFAYGLGVRKGLSPRYQNIHLLDESGDVMRLRFFYQDAAEGESAKMVLYRETDEGFPDLLEENDARDFLAKRGGFENWLNSSEILYIEDGISLQNDKDQDIFAIVEKNFEEGGDFTLTRLDIDQTSCQ